MARSVKELRREFERSRAELAATVDQLRTRISNTAEDIRHKVSPEHIKSEVSDYISHNFGKLGPGKESFTKAQSMLADMFERQPLVLGAIGLAVGAAAAGAFRPSELENEWIGDLATI